MKTIFRILPWVFVALFATEIVMVMLPRADGELHVKEFGRLPVLLNGRIQPIDSVARNALLQIRSTGDVPLEEVPSWKFWHHPKKLRSTEWLLEVMCKPDLADTRPIFLIHHPELISQLKLGGKGVERSGLRYYTFNDFRPVLAEITEQGRKAGEVAEAQRTTFQKQVVKLANAAFLYHRLKNSLQPEGTEDFARLLAEFEAAVPAGIAAFRVQQGGGTFDRAALDTLAKPAQLFDQVANLAYSLAVPPRNPDTDRRDWKNVGRSLMDSIHDGDVAPAVNFFARMATAYQQDDASGFNGAVADYRNWLQPKFAREAGKGRAEFYFNAIKAFLHATIIYVVAFLLAGGALLTAGTWPNLSESLRRSAFWLIVVAFVVHTFGLVFRMVLEGRPPVTNLYSSAIFIGWGACVLGMVLERFYKVGIGCAVAGVAGFVTLLIAHNLALGGDTMEMLRAVLDTNFWLATHVVAVTLGYASTFVAGTLAIFYIVLGLSTTVLKQQAGKVDLGKALTKMVYGIVCFATLFSFIGTVLGGIWADQSWGRFWGWDPKENGALLIVIWNGIILHARWGGLVRDRGIMNLAVVGNIVTSFSWFGVNMLGVGLHSYGFMDAAFNWLRLFTASQLAIIGLGLIPLAYWRSFRQQRTSAIPIAAPAKG